MSIKEILEPIFAKNTENNKWQHRFLLELFQLIFSIQGRVNYSNLARYSIYNECTFRRNFQKFFDWLNFNLHLMQLGGLDFSTPVIAAMDCSFITKSGKKTYGLDSFFSSCLGRNKLGLEVSLVSLIDVCSAKAWALDIMQTPPGLSAKQGNQTEFTRVDFYIAQLIKVAYKLKQVTYFVGDGYYAKTKVFNALTSLNKELITKLRPDANLRFLFNGTHPKNKRGPKTKYAEKVNWKSLDLRKWHFVGYDKKLKHLKIYSRVLNSPYFKRDFRIALVLNTRTKRYVVLASTDIQLSARDILSYYQLRFKIEFLFRDAKQFTGLNHCQARDHQSLNFHFNMSLAAVNLAQVQISKDSTNNSMNTFIRRAYNDRLIDKLFSKLSSIAEFDLFIDKINPILETVRNFGSIQKA